MKVEALYKALLNISEIHREIIKAIYLEGMTKTDCAKCLGLCRNTVAKYEQEALAELRELLKDFE